MENDELKEIIKMDIPDMKFDTEKLLLACHKKEKKINITRLKIIFGSLCMVILITIVFVAINSNKIFGKKNTIVDNNPPQTVTNYEEIINNSPGFSTSFDNINSNLKPSSGIEYGFSAETSVFRIDDVKINLLCGHVCGPPSEIYYNGLLDENYSYEEALEKWKKTWREGESWKAIRSWSNNIFHFYVNSESFHDSIYEINGDDFLDNYGLKYISRVYYGDDNFGYDIDMTEIKARYPINYLIDSKYFEENSGEIKIFFASYNTDNYGKSLYYYKDLEHGLIYLSHKSVDDAKEKYNSDKSFYNMREGYYHDHCY